MRDIHTHTHTPKVSNFLAPKIRASVVNKTFNTVLAVGEQAVEHAVNAMVLARRRLKTDVDGPLDFVCTPSLLMTTRTPIGEEPALQFLIILV